MVCGLGKDTHISGRGSFQMLGCHTVIYRFYSGDKGLDMCMPVGLYNILCILLYCFNPIS